MFTVGVGPYDRDMLRPGTLVLLTAAFFAAGCTETRSYDVTIRNDLPTPVTACLTKTGGPREAGWTSPEQKLIPPTPASDNTPPGVVIPPGGVATHNGVTGQFDPRYGQAYLRVYEGTPGLNDMAAINKGSPRRVDVPLVPGENRLVVKPDAAGNMTVVTPGAGASTTRP
jgi:hypothetical protein